VDFDLGRLGDRQFEHLVQALAVHHLGPQVQTFGAGPDGGREATWNGHVENPLLPREDWSGYGVIQAKYKLRMGEPRDNAVWLIRAINAELEQWASENSSRDPIPDVYLVATNVILSPQANGGIDSVIANFKKRAEELGLSIRTFALWHNEHIRALLEDARDVRVAYAAWITPGDILAKLIESNNQYLEDIQNTLYSHIAKSMLDDVTLNLTQAGSVGDKPIGIADVFVDLPASAATPLDREDHGNKGVYGIAKELINIANRSLDPSSQKTDHVANRSSRVVLVGGPGQGKSTALQFLCQIYRASFLVDTQVASEPDVNEAIKKLESHIERIKLEPPAARRWPFGIKLTALADALAKQRQGSVLQYIASEISGRAGSPISVVDLRHWLAQYPWLVVLDGFDEVPASSNREQVLDSVRDFLVDAAMVNADILVVATTRPQGYNDDFDPRRYRHYHLDKLDVEVALKYAHRLLEIRLGADSPRLRTVYRRLEKASTEEATARLLGTPLQATILALLIERLGQAPKDRWRLFSQYYRVIYQREQEKGGPLAEILHDFENHINAVHREAGFILQQRGEQAGDTTSYLTATNFLTIIAQRLEAAGYTDADAEQMALRFREVFTDRLVFLTELRDDTYGFEIRSLQEFMAGEAVVHQMEARRGSYFRTIAASSYWRNTVLFAVGKIFAEREYLCGEVVTLCSDLNLDNEIDKLVKPGSELALSILAEGVARTQPAYARPLAACACLCLNNATSAVRSLHTLDLVGMKAALDFAISEALSSSVSARTAAIIVLTERARRGNREDSSILLDALDESSDEVIRNIIKVAWYSGDTDLLVLLANRILRESPLLVARDADDDYNELGSLEVVDDSMEQSPELPEWLRAIRFFQGYEEIPDRSWKEATIRGLSVNFNVFITQANYDSPEWAAIADLSIEDGPWKAVKAVANFSVRPSKLRLAAALELCSTHFREMGWLMQYAPWPLARCFDAAIWSNTDYQVVDRFWDESEYISTRLLQLSQVAAAGELGDMDDWIEAENRWEGYVHLDELTRVGPSSEVTEYQGPLPVWPGISYEGLAITANSYGIQNVSDPDNTDEVTANVMSQMATVLRRLPACPHKSTWARGILFAADVLRRAGDEGRDPEFPANTLFEGPLCFLLPDDVADLISTTTGQWGGVRWINMLHPGSGDSPMVRSALLAVGKSRRIPYFALRQPSDIDNLLNVLDSVGGWPPARIAAHFIGLPVNDVSWTAEEGYQSEMVQRLTALTALLTKQSMSKQEIKGHVSILVNSARTGTELAWFPPDSVNLKMLCLCIPRSRESEVGHWARLTEVILGEFPELGSRVIKSLETFVSSAIAFPAQNAV
jgi:hypothetical protein